MRTYSRRVNDAFGKKAMYIAALKPDPFQVHSERLHFHRVSGEDVMAAILVIDDEAPIRTLVSEVLQSAGHDVVEASSGREGIYLYRQRPTDLVIVDMLMPDLNGLDTILALTREFLDVKVIAVSGVSGEHSLISTAKLLGARQILLKPFASQDMLSMVNYELAH